MYGKFYTGQFLGADFRKRTVQLARRSRTLRQIMESFIEGNQPYLSLKKKLFLSVPAVAWDLVSAQAVGLPLIWRRAVLGCSERL